MEKKYELRTVGYQKAIEEYLDQECFTYDNEPQRKLFDAMRYSLLSGGKRLRPLFLLEFARMSCGFWKMALPFAAAVEMIQTYSLIHDDLPCMDDDDFRRGNPSNHKVFGEAMAVLAGDALLTAAFRYLSKAELSADIRIRAVDVLSSCAGELGMVGGQVLDMEAENRQCTQQDVLDIQTRKTGALIRAACMMGVIAADGSEEQLKSAAEFATNFGLAFQIRDDMLDVIGNQEQLGKAVGTDESKNTFVQLYGIEKCNQLVCEYTQAAVRALDAFEDSDYLKQLALSLTERFI